MSGNRLVLEASDSFWSEDSATFVLESGCLVVSVAEEKAVDSYNQPFECSLHLTAEQTVGLFEFMRKLLRPGTVEVIAPLSDASLIAWIGAIPFDAWPQQHRLADGQIRPAMVTDPDWFGFKSVTDRIVDQVMSEHFPGCSAYQRMLSVVMPGQSIEPHRDGQAPHWVCRVHVPLLSNDRSVFIVGGQAHRLEPGMAYRVNTEVEHSVVNDGRTPRVHFMFDVRHPDGRIG